MSNLLIDASDELTRADKKHPPMAGMVEGLHTLKCEVAELEREVMRENTDFAAMRRELVQVAAMCLKFDRDILSRREVRTLCYDRDELPAVCPSCDRQLSPSRGHVTECGGCGAIYRVEVSP